MDLLGTSIELTRFVFLTGAVLAMYYKRRTGITPGGIIAPPFLAIVLDYNFNFFISIIVISIITRLTYKITMEHFALSRSWSVLINVVLGAIFMVVAQTITEKMSLNFGIETIGFVLPGLIAANSKTYGLHKVLHGLLAVVAATTLMSYIYSLLIPFNLATKLSIELSKFEPLVIANHYFLILLSLTLAMVVRMLFGVKAGGFMILPILLTLLTTAPMQLFVYGIATIFCYSITKIILRYSLIAGLERFMLCLILAYILVTAIDLIAIKFWNGSFYFSPIIYMTAIAVIVNDLCLNNIQKIFIRPAVTLSRRFI